MFLNPSAANKTNIEGFSEERPEFTAALATVFISTLEIVDLVGQEPVALI